MKLNFAIYLLLIFSIFSYANERVKPRDFWASHGYTEVISNTVSTFEAAPSWDAHSLSWPVTFQDVSHTIGNSMAEYQNYGDEGPYFHGGCDLRVKRRAPLSTPISGRIEAGHYGYTNNPDGSMTKYWKPWPASGDTTYFEIAVISDDGYRFEFHHMDETQIAPEVLKSLRAGGGRVEAGAVLGNTIAWPGFSDYHHTHYNIISPSGVRLNPEYYSPLLTDNLKPEVKALLASMTNEKTMLFGDGVFHETPKFFAVVVLDRQNLNTYTQPPVFAGIEFKSGEKYVWDFRERLLGPNGIFPNLWSFFIDSIKGPSGQRYETSGGYGEGQSVIRIPVPEGAKGNFTIKIGDQMGNYTTFEGRIEAR